MKQKTNKQFMVLSVIGIFIMVICHLAGEYFKYLKAFPFIAIFVFISGYFYKEENEKNVGKFIIHKFKKLMIPFFVLNLIYGILVNIFKGIGIVDYGLPITPYTLLIQPFINNSQYVFNFPAWFVPTLFLINVCYIMIHKLAKKTTYLNDFVLFIIFILWHLTTVYCRQLGQSQEFIVAFLKVMFFLPFFHFGYLYKKKWQKLDEKIPNIPYLLILFGINFTCYKVFGDLIYDMHEFSGFQTNIVILPFITSIVSILFFARIAKILSKWVGDNKTVNYISNHTFAIMTHHLFVMFLFSLILYIVNLVIPVAYFDLERFKKGWIYIYEIPGWTMLQQLIYVALGVAGPLLMQKIYDKIKLKFLGEK